MAIMIILFDIFNEKSIIDTIYAIAGYTYGPLLGLYAFGLFTKRQIKDSATPFIAILSPLISFAISYLLKTFTEYSMGYELLLLNGIITFVGLLIFTKRNGVVTTYNP
jgi:hypothetical protein